MIGIKAFSSILITTMLLSPMALFAATQGTEGAMSSGTLLITLNVADELTVSEIDDIPITLDGTNPIEEFCVQSNTPGILYDIVVSNSIGAVFQLESGNGDTVPFGIELTDTITGGPAVVSELGANSVLAQGFVGLTGPCTANVTTKITLTNLPVNEDNLVSGDYGVTLDIVVTPGILG